MSNDDEPLEEALMLVVLPIQWPGPDYRSQGCLMVGDCASFLRDTFCVLEL